MFSKSVLTSPWGAPALTSPLYKDDFPKAGRYAAPPHMLAPRVIAQPASAPIAKQRRTLATPATAPRLLRQEIAAPFLGLPEAPSDKAQAHRDELTLAVNACLAAALAPSTKTRYESAIHALVSRAETATGAPLLPIDSDDKLMAIFAHMKSESWGSIKVCWHAVVAWHAAEGLSSDLELACTPRASRFWRGLKREADHVKRPKGPIDVSLLRHFVRERTASPTPAGDRDAAIAATCFFGVRRISEALLLRRSDVLLDESKASLTIRRQKNDPDGVGIRCQIPGLPEWKSECPRLVLSRWVAIWDSTWSSKDRDLPLFFRLGKQAPEACSYDSFRRILQSHIKLPRVGTHSLRKGGAWWYKHVAKAPEEAIQAQGGWASKECMENCYSALTQTQRERRLLLAAQRASAREDCDGPDRPGKRARVH